MNQAPELSVNRLAPAHSRREILLTCIVLVLLFSLLIPWRSVWIDILLILCLCLTAAVTMICLSAKNSSQLEGLGPLAVSQGLCLLALTAALTRSVLLTRSCGRIVHQFSRIFEGLDWLSILPLVVLLGLVLIMVVFGVLRSAAKAADRYFSQILPFKKMALEADRDLEILTDQQARILLEKIRREASLYAAVPGLKLFFRCLMILVFLLPVGAQLFITFEFLVRRDQQPSLDLLNSLTADFTAAVLCIWIPLTLTVLGLAFVLSRKELIFPRPAPPSQQEEQKQTIRIVSRVSGQEEQLELLNPEFTAHASGPVGHTERIAEFEPPVNHAFTPERIQLSCSDAKEYYQKLADILREERFSKPVIFLTAETREELPVTVGVHTALAFAREGIHTLLIDLDPRCAVAKVFDLPPDTLQAAPQPSPIPNLGLYGIPKSLSFSDLAEKTAEWKADYDRIFVYGPGVVSELPDRKTTDSGTLMVLFTEDSAPAVPAGLQDLSDLIVCVNPLKSALKE